MKIFMESLDKVIWDAIENGPFVPKFEKDGSVIEKPWSQWTDAESKKAKFDCIAKNIITSALNSDEFFRVSQCKSSKEMWDTLEVTHEGTNEVKRVRKHALIQEYEMFRMLKGETIAEVQKRFTHIINHLMSLDKTFDKEELNIKILKCLDRLREHELEMNRLNVQESEDKHTRSIALKASKHKGKQDSSDESDEENLSLLSRKFNKFLKRNRNKDSKEKNPSYKEKNGKTKRAYIAWDENEISSSSEDEKTNICLVAENDDESCSSSEINSQERILVKESVLKGDYVQKGVTTIIKENIQKILGIQDP
ncbi:hypothetical protein PHAVU_011G118300 [Phaseolus vulgaris]|uniref:UBN2 domain-containing protein n=1 Tax=Phaseolus vulgaris TaxID=3885 RepID=V7AHJ6_PHAVU|nr:hypothetical protein PHAVU_011G118300g [Phaseolus vulgaris]ESW04705.1 hypothetical protein PHAVU_011G118300g [Phaseolus vulgaris]